MITIKNTEVMGWGAAIRGMRNPLNSWEKSDSDWEFVEDPSIINPNDEVKFVLGENDLALAKKLAAGGPTHGKYLRMITVYLDITAPLYWWKEFDTYKVGTVANSCSTMHKIHAKEFALEDFSHEHMLQFSLDALMHTVRIMNLYREEFLKTKDKQYWWQMIQLLPTSFNQKRTVMLNYEVLRNMYEYRKEHKLNEWREFCAWIETLPYAELITGKEKDA
jgi:hypothetical protein